MNGKKPTPKTKKTAPQTTGKNPKPKATLKTLDPEILLQLAQQFTQHNPPPTPRERKLQYQYAPVDAGVDDDRKPV